MKKIPEISIILPCYGAESFLPRIADCFEKQTFQNFEMILVNDGGSERQLQIMHELQQENAKIRIIDKENGGVSSARNAGMAAATGKYLMFTDPDDVVKPYYLQSLYNAATGSDADIAVGGITEIFMATNREINHFINIGNAVNYSKQEVIERVDELLLHVSVSKIYKTDFVRKNKLYFPVGVTIAEDVRFWLEMYMKTNPTFSLVEDCGYVYYRYNDGNANSRYQANLSMQYASLMDVLKLYVKELNWGKEKKENYLTDYFYKMGYRICINYFEKGTPLSFQQKVKLVKKELLQNEDLTKAFDLHIPHGNNRQLKLYDSCMKMKNALIIVGCFCVFYAIKRLTQ